MRLRRRAILPPARRRSLMATGLIERQGISVNRIALVARVLNLPMHADLQETAQNRVIDAIRGRLGERP